MLMTSNYLARRFGVRAGMPGFIGKKLCPHLEFVPHHFDKYKEASRAVRDILLQYDPHLVSYSLDEALCDVTDWLRANTDVTPTALAERIHEQVLARTQLTCSIGIGSNSGVAKIGANVRKPNGTFQVASDRAVGDRVCTSALCEQGSRHWPCAAGAVGRARHCDGGRHFRAPRLSGVAVHAGRQGVCIGVVDWRLLDALRPASDTRRASRCRSSAPPRRCRIATSCWRF
jgi:hypothetical protein